MSAARRGRGEYPSEKRSIFVRNPAHAPGACSGAANGVRHMDSMNNIPAFAALPRHGRKAGARVIPVRLPNGSLFEYLYDGTIAVREFPA
jgi:hypothetical protein